jgi:hypothetical protein
MIKRNVLQLGPMIRDRKVDAAADTAAVVTIPATPEEYNYIHHVQWSYDAAPTGGKLTIKDGASGSVLWEQAITAAGPGGQDPDELGSLNTATVITLAAGGAGVTGRIAGVRAVKVRVKT